MNKQILYLLFFLPFLGFTQNYTAYPAAIKTVLAKAGKNRGELEKTIFYCKKTGDPLKLKAAYFLIANMDSHFSMDYYWEDKSGKRIPFNELNYPDLNKAVAAFQKIKANHPGLRPHPVTSSDIANIKAEYLIKNIDDAFQEWRSSPHYKNISFNNFCEYILPYRVSTEPLQPWRTAYNKEFNWVNDKYKTGGLVPALSYVSTDFKNWFTNTFSWQSSKEPLPRLGASQLLFRKKGPCEDIADLVVFTMRSQGIPAAVDYVPFWATATASHFMNSVFDGQMHPISLDVAGYPAVNNVLAREPSKVLRLTYSKQPGTIAEKEKLKNIPPGFLRVNTYLDVTDHFWKSGDLNCKLFPMVNQPKYAYVCVFNGLGWRPTWWATIINNAASFKNMPKGVVFLPVYYVNGSIKPAGYPVAEGYHHELVLTPDTVHKGIISIKEDPKYLVYQSGKSYKLFYWNNTWKLLGKRIAAINSHELLFTNVPRNALYLLVPEYSEKKERPFMVMDDGKVIWW